MSKKKTQEEIWRRHQARKAKENNDRAAIFVQLAKVADKVWRW